MTLASIEATTVNGIVQLKERIAATRKRDVRAQVDAYRGADLVAIAVLHRADRDLLLEAFRACAAGFDADTLTMAFESYAAAVELPAGEQFDPTSPAHVAESTRANTNPLTGQPWVAGELQDVAQHHRGIEQGWVREAICVACANRAGDVSMALLPYRYAVGHLVWTDRRPFPPERTHHVGTIPDTMIAAMNSSSLGTVLPHGPGEASRAERDVMTAEAIAGSLPAQVALVADPGQTSRLRVLRAAGIPLF